MEITKTWAKSVLIKMGGVKHNATTKLPHGLSDQDFQKLKADI